MNDIMRIAINEIDFRLNILKERVSDLSGYDPIECIKQHGNIEMEMKYCQNISANFNVHCRTIIYKEIKKYTIFDYILLRNEAHEGTYNVD